MKFTESDIKNINQLFEDPHNAGYVLNFTNKSMREFFESELVNRYRQRHLSERWRLKNEAVALPFEAR
ncbi:hypothetical protein QNH14_23600 (plasmid) [Apirhabdus apintestini]|nr:hypothetical protein QNH14_23600 [Enterobacteriaceae bacterium CA-0114]